MPAHWTASCDSQCVSKQKGLGVHELLIPSPHHGVEVVGGMLLPELAQHQLLVARLDALHGALP